MNYCRWNKQWTWQSMTCFLQAIQQNGCVIIFASLWLLCFIENNECWGLTPGKKVYPDWTTTNLNRWIEWKNCRLLCKRLWHFMTQLPAEAAGWHEVENRFASPKSRLDILCILRSVLSHFIYCFCNFSHCALLQRTKLGKAARL